MWTFKDNCTKYNTETDLSKIKFTCFEAYVLEKMHYFTVNGSVVVWFNSFLLNCNMNILNNIGGIVQLEGTVENHNCKN